MIHAHSTRCIQQRQIFNQFRPEFLSIGWKAAQDNGKNEKLTLIPDTLFGGDLQFFTRAAEAADHLCQLVFFTLRYTRIEITLRDFACACPQMIWACRMEEMRR